MGTFIVGFTVGFVAAVVIVLAIAYYGLRQMSPWG